MCARNEIYDDYTHNDSKKSLRVNMIILIRPCGPRRGNTDTNHSFDLRTYHDAQRGDCSTTTGRGDFVSVWRSAVVRAGAWRGLMNGRAHTQHAAEHGDEVSPYSRRGV